MATACARMVATACPLMDAGGKLARPAPDAGHAPRLMAAACRLMAGRHASTACTMAGRACRMDAGQAACLPRHAPGWWPRLARMLCPLMDAAGMVATACALMAACLARMLCPLMDAAGMLSTPCT